MKNLNLKNLSIKDKVLLAKAVADIANDIYKSQNSYILNQIIKDGNYESENDLGKFWKQTIEAKSVKEVLSKKKQDLEKLQNEIKDLETQDENAIITETKITLYSKHTEVADEIAKELLQDLIANLDSKRLNKAASKR